MKEEVGKKVAIIVALAFIQEYGGSVSILQKIKLRTGSFCLALVWLLSSLGNEAWLLAEFNEGKTANVLFVVFDDLGNIWDRSRLIEFLTPNLDRLRSRGVFFSRAYCQVPLCNPSRASFLTGRRPDSTGVWDLDRHFRESLPHVETLPQRFRRAGYAVARIGKLYHYDVPNQIGTDGLDDPESWDTVENPKGRDVDEARLIVNPTPEKPISAALSWLAAEGSDEQQTDGAIASAAIDFLSDHRAKPFFLGVGFFRPHTPFVAPKADFELFPDSKNSFRLKGSLSWDGLLAASIPHNIRTPNYGLDESQLRKALQAYAASVSFVDRQFGRILEALDRLDLTQRTIIVVLSDHGYHLSEHGLWQKRTLFDQSARTPLLFYSPDLENAGKECRRVVELIDVAPTLVQMVVEFQANQELSNRDFDGRSLLPLLKAPETDWYDEAFTQIIRPNEGNPCMGRCITTERYRYIEWDEGRAGVELYRHPDDPLEVENLSGRSEFLDAREQLKQKLDSKVSGQVPKIGLNPNRL